MLQTILSAISVYISTSIDYLFLLIIIFGQGHISPKKGQVYAGQYIGTAFLVGISLIAAYLVGFIPQDWIVGLLGLFPMALGIRFAIVGEEEEDEDEIIERVNQETSTKLFWTVTLLTIASGGDNLGVYIPYFSSLNALEIIVALIVFAIGIIVLCEVSRYFSNMPLISETIEKYERIIVPVVFILLGIYIMMENDTLGTIWRIMNN